jgi:hypothetical protein
LNLIIPLFGSFVFIAGYDYFLLTNLLYITPDNIAESKKIDAPVKHGVKNGLVIGVAEHPKAGPLRTL